MRGSMPIRWWTRRITKYRRQDLSTLSLKCCAGPPVDRSGTPVAPWKIPIVSWRSPPSEWKAFMDDVQATLDKFSVPAAEQAEVNALIESTRTAIVVSGAEPIASSAMGASASLESDGAV